MLKTVRTKKNNIRITTKSHFAKAIVRRNCQRCFILGRTFKVQTILEKQL